MQITYMSSYMVFKKVKKKKERFLDFVTSVLKNSHKNNIKTKSTTYHFHKKFGNLLLMNWDPG